MDDELRPKDAAEEVALFRAQVLVFEDPFSHATGSGRSDAQPCP